MKVPYATKWEKEVDQLRKVALGCGLVEETKWGKPCFMWESKNVAIIIPLKESCALSFLKGALMKDPKGVLQKMGPNTQSGRWVKFTSLKEVKALQSALKGYFLEAIELTKAGKKVVRKKIADYPVPEALQAALDAKPKLRAAFEALTPGRRKSHILHISGAKQAKTRVVRTEKCAPVIMSGRGFNEYG